MLRSGSLIIRRRVLQARRHRRHTSLKRGRLAAEHRSQLEGGSVYLACKDQITGQVSYLWKISQKKSFVSQRSPSQLVTLPSQINLAIDAAF